MTLPSIECQPCKAPMNVTKVSSKKIYFKCPNCGAAVNMPNEYIQLIAQSAIQQAAECLKKTTISKIKVTY